MVNTYILFNILRFKLKMVLLFASEMNLIIIKNLFDFLYNCNMKKLLFNILFVPLFVSGQFIKVKTQGSDLNVMSSFNKNSEILFSLKNNTLVGYNNDFREGWLNIEGMYGEEGWIISDYVDAPNFKSNILNKIDENYNNFLENEIHEDNSGLIKSVEGTIVLQSDSHIYVNLDGNHIKLNQQKKLQTALNTYVGDSLKINIFTIPESPFWGDLNIWTGFMIVNYKDIQEVLMIKKYYSYLMGAEEQ